jgi:hypothetical protein
MALHADTHELGPATRPRASDTLGGFGGGANGHEPEYDATSSNKPLERRTNAATLPITNAELGWDAIRDTKQMPKRSTENTHNAALEAGFEQNLC